MGDKTGLLRYLFLTVPGIGVAAAADVAQKRPNRRTRRESRLEIASIEKR
jgi:hypothetical protein